MSLLSLNTNSHASVTSKLTLIFSNNEAIIEKIVSDYSIDITRQLEELNKFRDNISGNNYVDLSYLLTYRCFLEAEAKQTIAFQKTRDELRALISTSNREPSVLAANAFCDANISNSEKQNEIYISSIDIAYEYSKTAQSALLRYWITSVFAREAQLHARHHESLEATEYALQIALANKDKFREADIRRVIALSEVELKYYESALTNIQLAIDWYKSQNNQKVVRKLMRNRGYILISASKISQAKLTYQELAVSAEKSNDHYTLHSIKTNLAAIAISEGDYNRVVELCEQIYQYLETNPNLRLRAYADSLIAIGLSYQKKSDQANAAYVRGNKYFEEKGLLNPLADNYDEWAKTMADLGRYKEAYESYVKYKGITDKIFQNQRDSKLSQLKATFRSVEKDREIELLSHVGLRQKSELENNRLQTRTWWLGAIILFLAVILLLLMYNRVKNKAKALYNENKKLDIQRHCDPLTGCFNRRYLNEKLSKSIKNWVKTSNNKAALFLLDIDHFKAVNDNHGHAAGDQILIDFVLRLKASLRDQDHLVRIGGEEFLVVVMYTGDVPLEKIALKLLKAISHSPIMHEELPIPITTSIGYVHITKLRKNFFDIDSYIALADHALYKAKDAGRNRVMGTIIDYQNIEGLTVKESLNKGCITWKGSK